MSEKFEELKKGISDFNEERNWDQFHNPKNLTMAIARESSELMEPYQWLTLEESIEYTEQNKEEIEEEVADIFNFLVLFCKKANIDLFEATRKKLEISEKKYPVEKSKNNSKKYNKL